MVSVKPWQVKTKKFSRAAMHGRKLAVGSILPDAPATAKIALTTLVKDAPQRANGLAIRVTPFPANLAFWGRPRTFWKVRGEIGEGRPEYQKRFVASISGRDRKSAS